MDNQHRPRLLLVDDEPINLQVLRHILQADYRLLFARDGARALELAKQERPALILLDAMMPGLSGYEVCNRLKADPATAAIPVIFVTALADTQDEAHGFEIGAVDYITKPVRAPIVHARVRTRTCRWSASRPCAKAGCRSSSVWGGPPSTATTKPACT